SLRHLRGRIRVIGVPFRRRLRLAMVEEPSRNSTVGPVLDDEERREMDLAKERLALFLKKLTDGDLLCLATRNGLFDAEGRPSEDHFIIDVRSPFIHQTIAVEHAYWAAQFRPKLEADFLSKMVTVETEMNVLGLPSEMIVPESIQRRGSKKNSIKQEPISKVLLQPGTYVVTVEGVSLVIDRSSIPGLPQDIKGDNHITEHLLIPFPSARIDSLFFSQSSPPLNGHAAHPSEDTTTEEDERPPLLERSFVVDSPQKAGKPVKKVLEVVEVKEEDTADETFDSPEHKEEESNGVAGTAVVKTEVEMPSLAPESAKKQQSAILDQITATPTTNGTEGAEQKKEKEDSQEPAGSRKSRASSSSKRDNWQDWVEKPKDSKRKSIPSRKRQITDDVTNGQAKRSKDRSGSASSSSPPPLLEREEPTAEPVEVKKRPRSKSKSTLSSISEDNGVEMPAHPLISVKPQNSRSLSTPVVIRINRHLLDGQHRRQAEDGQGPSTSYSSIMVNGHSVIGVKPLSKDLTAHKKTPKKEKKDKDTPVKTRVQAPRAAVEKAQKERKKRWRSDDFDDYGGDDESGDEGDQRCRSSDEEEGGEPRAYDETESAATIQDSRAADVVRSVEDRGEFKIVTIFKDEPDDEKRKEDEAIMVRIRKEEAEAAEAKKRLAEKLARRDAERAERAERAALAEGTAEVTRRSPSGRDEGPKCPPSYSNRTDQMFLAMMQGGEAKKGPYLTRSLASIYQKSRDFYQSLMKPAPCLEWHPRPRVGPDVDGYVHQVSGFPVKVANGAEMASFQLLDLHNHREFRLGEIVWAKFQREYWPGYVKAFIPAEAFTEYRGDAVMVQWISEEPQYNYVCYADVYHFDLYFGIMYLPAKTDKTYTINVAKALAMDGRPGFWEEYITKPIFEEITRIGGNTKTIPAEHVERIHLGSKGRNPTSSQVSSTIATIHQKEVNHFQHYYKAIYKGRNTNRFVPKKDNCTAMLCLESSTVEEDDIKIAPRKTNVYRVYKDETIKNKRWHYNVQPEHSTIPTFAEETVEVHVTDRSNKDYQIYRLYNGASTAPIQETLYEQQPVPLGVHAGPGVFDDAAKARLAEYMKNRQKEEAEMNGEDVPEEKNVVSATQAPVSPDLTAAISNMSALTSHEVLHLTDHLQRVIDPATKQKNEAWVANTLKCAEHLRLEFEVKEKKIRENNEKFEEKKRQEAEEKAKAQREKEEKAAARSMRNGALITPVAKPKKPRLSKDGEIVDKPPRESTGSTRGRKKKEMVVVEKIES
ncbi:hypothetical protein PENTCL1PPCAC_28437, partial [Pristionchus entomophagus]